MIAFKFLRTWFFLLPLAGQEFNYDNPMQWILKNPQCAGYRQSPIALNFGKAHRVSIPPLSFQYYDVPVSKPVEATNSGHTVSVAIQKTIDGNIPSISGGGLDAVYEVVGIHFHWGSPQRRPGSEHIINGKKYDLEMHIVHKNMKYATIEDASSNSDGLAVLAVLFKGTQNRNIGGGGLNAVFGALCNLTKPQSTQELYRPITMRSVLGNLKTKQFFKYPGSLTTPPCSEAVTWFIFTDIVPIEIRNLKRFWTLFDNRGVPLLDNYRPIQLIRNRKVYLNKAY